MRNKRIISCTAALVLAAGMSANTAAEAEYDWLSYDKDIYDLLYRGDMNSNKEIDTGDLDRYIEYMFSRDGNSDNDSFFQYVCDVNSDGTADIADLITLKAALAGDTRIWTPGNIPVMDGSTSAIPLEAGFKAKMLGIPYVTAKKNVYHNKTHISFNNFLNGECDLIFTVPISESQQQAADEAGVHLNLEPVAKEGFVFVVSKENPVDSLTKQQIKDIYSGKITNWSEVGGNDEEIIPYQRNNDSGSQNYMTEFMKGSELMEPPKGLAINSMGGLMDAVTAYSNSSQAIGYSVYSYAAQMYENSSDVKFIGIDGIKPSRESMADETYPLLSCTYIMYRDDASEETLDFIKWAVSEEGQQCVLENGYVPVEKMEYPEKYRPYSEKGTGIEKDKDYIPDKKYTSFRLDLSQDDYAGRDLRDYRIGFLKDKALQNTVNEDLKAVLDHAPKSIDISIYALNGYMSVTVRSNQSSINKFDFRFNSYDYVMTLNYDLIRGKRLDNFSDLFYKDISFIQTVNDNIADRIKNIDQIFLKSDFLGLTGSIDNFSPEALYTGDDNAFLRYNFKIDYSSHYLPDYMVTGKYYDMRDLVEEGFMDSVTHKNLNVSTHLWNEWDISERNSEDITYEIEGSRFHTAEEVEKHSEVYKKIHRYLYECSIGHIPDNPLAAGRSLYINEPDFRNDEHTALNVITAQKRTSDRKIVKWFDPDTGDVVTFKDIFGTDPGEKDHDILDIYDIDPENGTVQIKYVDISETETVKFDPEKVNMKYIISAEK